MKATQLLHNMGQSIWLDNITRDLLDRGTLEHYIRDLSVTGLTSNPTIFDHAIKNSASYDASIREKLTRGKSGEALFFDIRLSLKKEDVPPLKLGSWGGGDGPRLGWNTWVSTLAAVEDKNDTLLSCDRVA